MPDALSPLFVFLYRFGSLWAVGLVGVAALVARRWRLARDLALAGVLAWFIGRLLGVMLVGHESLGQGLRVVTRLDDSPSYPVVRLAVIVAVICAASPYLTPPDASGRAADRAVHGRGVPVPRDRLSERRVRGHRARLGCRGRGASRVRVAGRSPDPRCRWGPRSPSSASTPATSSCLMPRRAAGPTCTPRMATGGCSSACSDGTRPTPSSSPSSGGSSSTRTAGPPSISRASRTSSTRPTRCCSRIVPASRLRRSSSRARPGPVLPSSWCGPPMESGSRTSTCHSSPTMCCPTCGVACDTCTTRTSRTGSSTRAT